MSLLGGEATFKPKVYRVPLNRGGYTRHGMYFGTGEKLWEYEDHRGRTRYVRAPDAKTARTLALAEVGRWGAFV